MKTEGQEIPQTNQFRCLRTVIQNKREINEDICSRTRIGRMKWRQVSRILCDRHMPWRFGKNSIEQW